MIRNDEGIRLVPELYSVPAELVPAEYKEPGSQERIPLGLCPFLWAQSLYIVGKLLQEVVRNKNHIFNSNSDVTGFSSAGRIRPSKPKTVCGKEARCSGSSRDSR